MSEQSTEGDVDLRRRAAWLLAMLVLVAVLVVVVMTTLLGTDKGGGNGNAVGPDPITSFGPPSTSRTSQSTSAPTSRATTSASSTSPTSPTPTAGSTTCPTSAPCAFDTDIGNAVAAINAYRTSHGMPVVPTAVSAAAKTCALDKGNGCDGGWAWTSISAPADGKAAVAKIVQFAKLLQSGTKSIGIGWAYDPGAKQYYFSTIRES